MLFKNSFEFHINQKIIDECGNFIILDINIQDYRMTLVAAIYGPNEDNPDFFKKLVFNINQFDNSSVIIAGDWNVVQDYRVDTVNYIGENNPKSKLKIHQMINNMDLVDVWREKHPGIRRYTWRGSDKKQSGLDYFLVSSDIDTLGYSIKFYIGERCFLNGSVLKQENEELIDIQQVLSQNIWLTPFIKIGDNVYDQNML